MASCRKGLRVRPVADGGPCRRAGKVCELDCGSPSERQRPPAGFQVRPLQLVMADVTREHVTIDGCRLEYRWHGPRPGEAPTVVFLHEGLGSITQWRDFPAALCERTRCGGLVYNRQGYGGSDPFGSLSPDFMHHEALDVLPRLLEAFDVTQPVLFGHSDGGSIALTDAGPSSIPPAA